MTAAPPKAVYDCNILTDVPQVYDHPYDPDDSHYVDLALMADAQLMVSRDRHLLVLADPARKEGRDFQARFPQLRILDPVQLLRELEPPVGIA